MVDRDRDRDERPDRARSRSLRRRDERLGRDEALERGRDYDRDRRRTYSRSYSRSPPRKRRHHSGSRSRSYSRSRSPRREKGKEVSRRKEKERDRDRDREYKRRSRSRSRTRRRDRRRRSRSSSSSSSTSYDSDDRHKKRRKDKHRKRSRSRDRKERKKSKRDKKKNKKGSSTSDWGKYGIINESNMYEKEEEFRTWLVEERIINPEVLSKEQTKKEFAKFAEDYNTATLPHEKYYNIASFERRMTAMRAGELLPPSSTYDPDADLRAHASAHKKRPPPDKDVETFMNKEQLQELRKVQQERYQVGKMKLMGMNVGQSFGVRMDGNEFEE
ncbi:hypothetical protein ACEPAH_7140 [Sanghuangporus vaninii]